MLDKSLKTTNQFYSKLSQEPSRKQSLEDGIKADIPQTICVSNHSNVYDGKLRNGSGGADHRLCLKADAETVDVLM